MLDKLVLKDSKWRQAAKYFCGCSIIADDLVQEMYLKLSTLEREVKDSYVIVTIKNLAMDHFRHESNFNRNIEDEFFKDIQYTFELSDLQNETLDRFETLNLGYKYLIEESQDRTLRDIAKELNTNHVDVFRQIKKARAILIG